MMPPNASVSAWRENAFKRPCRSMKFNRKFVAPAIIRMTVMSSMAKLPYDAMLSGLTAKPPVDTADMEMLTASNRGMPAMTYAKAPKAMMPV